LKRKKKKKKRKKKKGKKKTFPGMGICGARRGAAAWL
jgi:hypothetical protein